MPKDLQELPRLDDSLTYLYAECCRIEQEEFSIALVDENGRTPVPVASLSVLMLGPGTTVTHAAMRALAENGCTVLWTGQDGVRMYAAGTGETRKAYRLEHQARLVSDEESRTEVAWRMYELRFGERLDRSGSLSTVRGAEGVRMKQLYRETARQYGVPWGGRKYDLNNWDKSDPLNKALSAANSCLYGLCHAAIVSGGYSTGLGFLHAGKQLSFVYDIADLFKAETTIPTAFLVVGESFHDIESRARQTCRRLFREERLIQKILPTIDALLDVPDPDPRLRGVDTKIDRPTPLWEKLWETAEAR